jgi:hypothetical protein
LNPICTNYFQAKTQLIMLNQFNINLIKT